MKSIKPLSAQLGLDLMSDETSVTTKAIRRATNVDIDRDGNIARRRGQTVLDDQFGFHGLYTSSTRGESYVALGATLYRILKLLPTLELSEVFQLGSASMLDYTEYNGTMYFSNRDTLGWIAPGESLPRLVGVEKAPAPTVALADGGLAAGNYTFAISFADDRGEEGPLSSYVPFELTAPGGVRLTNLPIKPGHMLRIYMTNKDGELLFCTSEMPASLTQVVITSIFQGAIADTAHMARMPAGEFVRWHNGRLYTALGNELRWSEPLRPGLHNPRHGVMSFNGPISIVEPVQSGIFVGDSHGVWFLNGEDPIKFTQTLVSTCKAVRRSSIRAPGEHFSVPSGRGFQPIGTDLPVAVWLSTSGYTVGMPDGSTKELHPERVRVPGGLTGRSVFAIRNGVKQVLTAVNSDSTAAYGVAANYSLIS